MIQKYYLLLLLLFLTRGVSGQSLSKVLFPAYAEYTRTEVRIPQDVNGYRVLKADLHTHTFFSDGSVSPEMRVDEAWKTGLDVLAITDHIEYKTLREYIHGDENVSYELAKQRACERGILLIKGSEVTRKHPIYGHFNALFIQDANRLRLDDPKAAIAEAIAQGGFITWNHPAWAIDTCRLYDFQQELLAEKMIHGIEVFNNNEYYPLAQRWSREYGLTILSCSDVHTTVYVNDGVHGAGCAVSGSYQRPMTLIFAEEATSEAVREALFARRTLASFGGYLAGDSTLLADFFRACVSVNVVCRQSGTVTYRLDNLSGLPFRLAWGRKRMALLPDRSMDVKLKETDKSLQLRVENAFVKERETLTVCLPL